MCLAAEFKRASPSKGLIAADLKAHEQGVVYAKAGAGVISVLTEERWFKGGLDDLRGIRLATQECCANTGVLRPAILRKDFVTTKYQILEGAANGADSVLLIVAVLPLAVLKELIDYARSLGMEPLVEVHALCELDVAIKAGAKVVGVNNRNLHSMKLDLCQTEKVASALTEKGIKLGLDVILCALSGMSNAADVDRYRNQKVQMCLIGESLMRAANPGEAIKGLCLHPDDYAKSNRGGGAYTAGLKIVKICGLTNVEDALCACRAGANLLGVIFAEKSKRKVNVDGARKIVDAVRKFGERSDRVTIDIESTGGGGGGSALSSLVSKSMALEQASRRPLVVGVFQNQSLEYVKQMVDECGLDMVQLHGQEGMEAANSMNFGVPALRVVDIEYSSKREDQREGSKIAINILNKVTSDPLAILLDTSIKGAKEGGGTGVIFDWAIAKSLQSMGLPVIIAGGLTPDNVDDAVSSVRPWGIDVAGGVEASAGKKDLEKVVKFVSSARIAAVEANKGF